MILTNSDELQSYLNNHLNVLLNIEFSIKLKNRNGIKIHIDYKGKYLIKTIGSSRDLCIDYFVSYPYEVIDDN